VFAGPEFPNVISPGAHPDICQTVVRMIDEIREQGPGHRMVIRGLAWVLMTLLHRMCQARPVASKPAGRVGVERVSPALRHLAAHYADDVDPRELAAQCRLSVTHFYRVFHEAVGTTPQQYQARLRCRMAAGMLREHLDRPIIDIAFGTGFNAVNTFNRRFRETLGMSPRQWRGRAAPRGAASR
jgi:AraC family transcriptional regulator, activator of mtrCDE